MFIDAELKLETSSVRSDMCQHISLLTELRSTFTFIYKHSVPTGLLFKLTLDEM